MASTGIRIELTRGDVATYNQEAGTFYFNRKGEPLRFESGDDKHYVGHLGIPEAAKTIALMAKLFGLGVKQRMASHKSTISYEFV